MGNKGLLWTLAIALSTAVPANPVGAQVGPTGKTEAHESGALEQIVERKPAMFESLQLSDNLQPMVDFYTTLYTETDNALIYNNKTFRVLEEVPIARDGSRLPRSEVRKAERERNKVARELAKAKEARYSDISYAIGHESRLQENFDRMRPWLRHMMRELAQNGMSFNTLALPALESMMNPDAISRVRAVGISQFMHDSGQRFMIIDGAVDERLDPVYEMRATARYLALNYARYGRESHAIGSYHSGIANYDRATLWSQANLDEDAEDGELFETMILEFTKQRRIRGSFRSESQKYVPIFKGVDVGLQRHFSEYFQSDGYEFDTVKLEYAGRKRLTVRQVLKDLQIDKGALSTLNPAILCLRRSDPGLSRYFRRIRSRVSQTLPEGYELRLPLGMGGQFLEEYSGILEGSYETYTNSMSFDALSYETPPDQLYQKIIERRKNGDLTGVQREELEEVRQGYERLLEKNHLDYNLSKWLDNRLAVVGQDIYQYDLERKRTRRGKSYLDRLLGFAQKVSLNSENQRPNSGRPY